MNKRSFDRPMGVRCNHRGWNNERRMTNNAVYAQEHGELPADTWEAMSKEEMIAFLTSLRECDGQDMRKFEKLNKVQLMKFLFSAGYHHHKGEPFEYMGKMRQAVYTVDYSAFDWLEFYMF